MDPPGRCTSQSNTETGSTIAKPSEDDFRRYRVPVYGVSNGEKVTGTHAQFLRWIFTKRDAYEAGTAIFGKGVSCSLLVAEKHYIGQDEDQDAAMQRVVPLYQPIMMDGIARWPLRPVMHDVAVYHGKGEDPRPYICVVCPTYAASHWSRTVQPVVRLPDGRKISIAGEHEDSYDPDFCIYNDVCVTYPETWPDTALAGTQDFYLYRQEDFPPTDFHTADYYRWDGAEHIVIIGNVSYRHLRKPGYTPINVLDCLTMQISQMDEEQSGHINQLGGYGPGWISGHKTRIVVLDKAEPITGYYASSDSDGHSTTCHEDKLAYPSDRTIGVLVYGGSIWTGESMAANKDSWLLDPTIGNWRKLEQGLGETEEEDNSLANAREKHQWVLARNDRLGLPTAYRVDFAHRTQLTVTGAEFE